MKSVIYSFNTSTGFKCYNSELTPQENSYAYGDWCTQEGLGCNFKVGYELLGQDHELGPYKRAADSIDHKFLNKDIGYFKNKSATPEAVAKYLYFEASKDLKKESLYLTAYPNEAVCLKSGQITLIKKHEFLSRVSQVYLSNELGESDRVIDRGLLNELLEVTAQKTTPKLSEGKSFSELSELYFKELKSCALIMGIKSELGFVCFYEKDLFFSFGRTSPVVMKI